MKASAITNSNIALIKYWGKYDERLFLPMNSSLSMTLDSLNTKTTVEFSDKYKNDIIQIDGKDAKDLTLQKVIGHLNLIRSLANINLKAKVISENNFPIEAGLASSASGFAALTVAACTAAGLNLDKKQLSIISRQGSGSSCRSIFGGYVEWLAAKRSEDSFARQIADESHFNIRDTVAIVSSTPKKVSSREGMQRTVETSPLYKTRLELVKNNFEKMKKAILGKDFTQIGKIAEFDCLLMHACMLTTNPALIYWSPTTIEIIHAVENWRDEDLEAYYTSDAGSNVHILTLPKNTKDVEKRLKEIEGVINIIHNKPGGDVKIISKHLF